MHMHCDSVLPVASLGRACCIGRCFGLSKLQLLCRAVGCFWKPAAGLQLLAGRWNARTVFLHQSRAAAAWLMLAEQQPGDVRPSGGSGQAGGSPLAENVPTLLLVVEGCRSIVHAHEPIANDPNHRPQRSDSLYCTQVGAHHLSVKIDSVVAAMTNLFALITGRTPRFRWACVGFVRTMERSGILG